MATSVIIDNYKTDQRLLLLIPIEDVTNTEKVWNQTHPVLTALVKLGKSDKVLNWCDVSVPQYQFLLKKQLEKFFDLSEGDQANNDNPHVITLRFLLAAYIKSLFEITGNDVDVIRVHRIDDNNFAFNTSINVVLATKRTKSTPTDGEIVKREFKIVVDNTKNDKD
jgi:hypothetical protein